MSASRLKKSPIEQVESRDEMENCVREICLLTLRRSTVTKTIQRPPIVFERDTGQLLIKDL